jgi:hypothetical protein
MTLWWGTIISLFKAAAISPFVSSTLIRVALQKSDTKLGPLYKAALALVCRSVPTNKSRPLSRRLVDLKSLNLTKPK